jgi:hypothetical protein
MPPNGQESPHISRLSPTPTPPFFFKVVTDSEILEKQMRGENYINVLITSELTNF